MKTKLRSPKTWLFIFVSMLAGVIMLFGSAGNASAQWTTSAPNIYYNGGNVGIGTATPQNLLHVHNASTSSQAFSMYTNGTTTGGAAHGMVVGMNSDNNALVWSYEANALRFGTSNTERMRIDSNGNLGLGATSVPSWSTNYSVLAVNSGGFNLVGGASSATHGNHITDNAYYNSGWKYTNTNKAGVFSLSDGTFMFRVASSGTAGNAITWTTSLYADNSGNVGIGTTTPNDKLEVAGNIRLTGGGYAVQAVGGNLLLNADGTHSTIFAVNGSEKMRVDGSNGNTYVTGNLTVSGNISAKYQDMAEWVPSAEQVSPGTVVVLDTTKSNQVISSTSSYDTRVAGVVSAQPGIALGESGANRVLVATTGRVLVNVDATTGPIHVGDLLVTSNVVGVAMKSEPVNLGGVQLHRPGTLIGKALEPLEKGSGKILVLLSLQ